MTFNWKMISRFHDEVLSSLIAKRNELMARPSEVGAELEKEGKRGARRRSPRILIPRYTLLKDKSELTEKNMREAERRFGQRHAMQLEEEIYLLQALRPLFAYAYVQIARQSPAIGVPASTVLDGSFIWVQPYPD
jgi:hypothetical protein